MCIMCMVCISSLLFLLLNSMQIEQFGLMFVAAQVCARSVALLLLVCTVITSIDVKKKILNKTELYRDDFTTELHRNSHI